MTSPLLALSFLGATIGAGIFLAAVGLYRAPVRLSDAFAALDGSSDDALPRSAALTVGSGEKVGAWLYQRLRLPLSESTVRTLALQGRSIADFFTEKLVWTVLGLALPPLWVFTTFVFEGHLDLMPAGFSVVGAIIGYFIPDLRLRRATQQARAGASEALLMFFDLVTLERLANRSVTQALQSAAGISETSVFQRIRHGLDRAKLEQVAPWHELKRLSAELNLPAISDIADVLRLDEQGASLAEPLRARVRELRDAQLAEAKQAAQEQTERMTLWMTLPVLIFGAIVVAPPLLSILQR